MELAQRVHQKTQQNDIDSYLPEILDITKPDDLKRFEYLIEDIQVSVYDEIQGQIGEWIKCTNPQIVYSEKELINETLKYFSTRDEISFGNWVYYPWSKKLVHLLPEEMFVEVRTNRNNYKITPAEQKVLMSKIVGVIGLSVGQSTAITMAMERSFGEIRIADFDKVELSNLNRIRTNTSTLELKKTFMVAREIAEIDPYLNVIVYDDGVLESNIDTFFNHQNNKLDLCVDECDSLDIKFLIREKAKELRVPVLMETSDRGMLDVERFDLDPDREPFHGLVKGLDVTNLKKLKTNEEKAPYVLAILNLPEVSSRMKASMIEIEESITTWPQLASSVVLGGAISTSTWKKIVLNDFKESGRFYFDLDDVIGQSPNKNYKNQNSKVETNDNKLVFDVSDEVILVKNSKLSYENLKFVIESACLAPSGGNCQPWKWGIKKNNLLLFHDKSRSNVFLDYQDTGSLIAFGAALENISISLGSIGYHAEISLYPSVDNPLLIARVVYEKEVKIKDKYIALVTQINKRQTNRLKTQSKTIQENELSVLKSVIERDTIHLSFVNNIEAIHTIANIIGESDKILLTNEHSYLDFLKEIRWTSKEAENTADGIDLRTLHLSISEKLGLEIIKERNVFDLIQSLGLGNGLKKLSKKQILNSGAVGLISCKVNKQEDFIYAGMELQRVWLKCTELNIGFQPMSPITFMFKRYFESDTSNLSDEFNEVLPKLYERLNLIFRFDGKSPIFLFRIFYTEKEAFKSLRKPFSESFIDLN